MDCPDLTLILLAFNEEAAVTRSLVECLRFLDTLSGNHEVILLDDGSTDSTRALAEKVAAKDARVRVVSHRQNRGMGAGMRTGIDNARGELFSCKVMRRRTFKCDGRTAKRPERLLSIFSNGTPRIFS